MVVSKLENVLNKNYRFKTFEIVSVILYSGETLIQGIPKDMILEDMVYFKFVPMITVDAGKSISIFYKEYFIRFPVTFFI